MTPLRAHRRFWTTMAIALPCLSLLYLCWGRGISLSPMDVLSGGGDTLHRVLLRHRFLRLLTALTCGGALAMAGAAYQAVLRNPLAEPFILGISGGAGLGAALALASGLAALHAGWLPGCAFVGALVALATVLLMARGSGAEYADHVMLSGVITGSLCASLLMFLVAVVGMETLRSVTWWMLGSLEPGRPELLYVAMAITALAALTLTALGREVNVLSFGEEMAFHLGLNPKVVFLAVLGIASLLTATTVAVAGIVGFAGLVVPHILRRMLGADHRVLFPASLTAGGLFLLMGDLLARNLIYPRELPIGVITAFIGGPFFLWVLNRRRRGEGP